MMTTAAGYLANGKMGAYNAAAGYLFNQTGESKGGGQGGDPWANDDYQKAADQSDSQALENDAQHLIGTTDYHYKPLPPGPERVAAGFMCIDCLAVRSPPGDSDRPKIHELCSLICDKAGKIPHPPFKHPPLSIDQALDLLKSAR